MNGRDTMRKVAKTRKTTTPTPKVKPDGKVKMGAKTRSIKINDDSEVEKTKQDWIHLINSNHKLRMTLYKSGVFYGRMMESRVFAWLWATFVLLILCDIIIIAFNLWKPLVWIASFVWVGAQIAISAAHDRAIKKNLAEQNQRLEQLKDSEIKEWEDK